MNILVSELEQCHPDYNPVVARTAVKNGADLRAIETYTDFYRGGRKFELHKDRYLRSRPIEEFSRPYRNNRLGAAYYTPHSGGIGANLCGTALQYPPLFTATITDNVDKPAAKSKKADPRLEYWQNLNSNIDGQDSDTRSLAWCLLENLIIHKRAYIVVNFPDADDPKAATFSALSAKEVDDWQTDENGKYEWVRTHCVDLVRSKMPYGPIDTERHTWTFYTDTETVDYVAEKPIGGQWAKEQVAAGESKPHGLGVVPVFPIEVEENFWVMDRLFSTAHAYFNREASRCFSIDAGAHAMPVIKTEKELNNMVTADGFAIHLRPEPGEDFFWRCPDSGIYEALKNDCDYLLNNLYSALNQMALQAAAKSGNPASGTKQMADSHAIKTFLSLLCNPIIAAFRKATKAVQTYRDEEDLTIIVSGMTNFDVQSIELEINRCVTFNAIPGMPQTARKESMRQTIRTYLPDISEASKKKIEDEFQEDLPEVDSKQATVVGQEPGSDPMINATTGRAQGFAPGQVSQSATKTTGEGKAANVA